MNRFDVVIIGGGPAGLSCAAALAAAGVKVVLLERKKNIGSKVCAGGITWHGLIRQVPADLIQRTFPEQHIFSNWQRIRFTKPDPIIATVNREELGRWIMEKAVRRGAEIRNGCYVRDIAHRTLTATNERGSAFTLRFDQLVGADGSTSMVRRFLGIPAKKIGVGINYQIEGAYEQMEWHLNTALFGSGYAWIFPHRQSVSIGAYVTRGTMNPDHLKTSLITWAATRGFDLANTSARAEFINYDFRGFQFGNTWLAGDAAGLASGLTGEGINPAIVSGGEIARKIIDPGHRAESIAGMVARHRKHAKIVELAARGGLRCTLLTEILVLLLRLKIVDFQKELSM
jgi:geranylgeranyl reductase family protein